MRCTQGNIVCRYLLGLCGGGTRIWYGRQNDWDMNVVKKMIIQWQFLTHLQEVRIYDSCPMMYQPTSGVSRVKQKQLKSHLLLVYLYLVLSRFQIKRGCFSLVFTTYVHKSQYFILFILFIIHIFSLPQKSGPYAHHQPVSRFPSHQQYIDLKNQQKLQSPPKLFRFSNNHRTINISSFILLIIYLCVFYLLYQSSLILKPVDGCVRIFQWAVSKPSIRI